MKYTLLLIVAFSVTGCGQPTITTTAEQRIELDMRATCLDGVVYYRTGYQLAPAYNRDGALKLCTTSKE